MIKYMKYKLFVFLTLLLKSIILDHFQFFLRNIELS